MNNTNLKQTLDFISRQTLDVQFYTDKINEARTRLIQAREEIQAFLTKTYALTDFVGKSYTQYRFKWGTFKQTQPLPVFTVEKLSHYIEMTPHGIFDGNQINFMLDSTDFDVEKHYLVYADYEHSLDSIELLHPEISDNKIIYECLIFEL